MELFRFSRSIYGGDDVLIGANYGLLLWFVAAGAIIIIVHAIYKVVTKTSERA